MGGRLGAVLSLENWTSNFQEFWHYLGNLISATGGSDSDKLTQTSCPPLAASCFGESRTGVWLHFPATPEALWPALLCLFCSLLDPFVWCPLHTHQVCVEWMNKLETEEMFHNTQYVKFVLAFIEMSKKKKVQVCFLLAPLCLPLSSSCLLATHPVTSIPVAGVHYVLNSCLTPITSSI